MAKEIRWSQRASEQLLETLEFWEKRTASQSYSMKLFVEIESILELISEYPEIGRRTTGQNVRRVVIENNYGLYYSSTEELIEVKLWRSLKMDPQGNEYET